MASGKKVIAVIGGTGSQGGGVVSAILADPAKEFKCRVLTRNASSPKALALKEKGCEIVEANLDNVESLKKAFAGAYGVFAVTNFLELFSVEKEVQQGKDIADAARATGVQHTVWSTLDGMTDYLKSVKDTTIKPLGDGWVCPIFDGKNEITKYFRQTKTPFTELYTCYYMDNFTSKFGLQRFGEKKYGIVMNMGDTPLEMVSVADIGRAAVHILKHKDKFLNNDFYIVGDSLPVSQVAQRFTKALGVDFSYVKKSYEEFTKLGFPGAEEFGNMFQFQHKYAKIFGGKRDISKCQAAIPELESFDKWLELHKKEILEFINQEEQKAKSGKND